jgi:hypothetical protein
MADNLALKLLVAGIIGAVVGAALAERYHFPTGLVYGGLNRPTTYRTRPPIDPTIGSGRADREEGPRIVIEEYPNGRDSPPPPDWRDYPPPRYRPLPPRPAPRTAWCWREFEDWNFRTTGRYVRCSPGSGRRERDI